MTLITKEDRDFFRQNGYVVVKQVVPKENCDRVIEAIWEFLGRDPENRDEWYMPPKGMETNMITQKYGNLEMFHHQSMWDNRQHPKVYQAFAELWNNEKLWVSIDRAGIKPPVREGREDFDISFIHWDMDTSELPSPLPHPMGVQGVLCLADTSVNQGGFQCVPSIYRNLEEWLKTQPADRNPYSPDITGHEVIPITGNAGDLIIWDKLLPHGNGHNYCDIPRYCQYIAMNPANPSQSREKYIESWRTNRTVRASTNENLDPRGWEQNTYSKPAELTALGRKLLGLDSWFE